MRGQEVAHLGPRDKAHGNNAYDLYDLERTCLLVVDLRRVHLCPGYPQHAAVTGDGHRGRDARDRYFGDDHRMPGLDLTAAPDPYHCLRQEGCWQIGRARPPIGAAACGKENE